MKLSKVSGRLILRSAIVAIVMLMALLWVLIHLFMWEWEFAWYLLRYVPLLFILPSLSILLFGCLLFLIRDVYIHSVTNKHARLIVVARVLGALGAAVALSLFVLYPPILTGLCSSLMAIGGVKLAHLRPKIAGGLMLLGGITAWIVSLFVPHAHPLGFLMEYVIDPRLPDELGTLILLGYIAQLIVPSILLIPGGVLALLSARKKGRQEKLSLSGRADDGPNKCW